VSNVIRVCEEKHREHSEPVKDWMGGFMVVECFAIEFFVFLVGEE